MPTSKAIEMTNFAVVFELGMFRKSSRSKARPISGERTTTGDEEGRESPQWSFWVRTVNTKAAANAWAPKAKLKTPVA